MTRFSLLVSATLALAACGGGAGPALPPVSPAPVAACLTLVLAEEPTRENPYGRDVQRAVRTSFETAMVGAGFNVVADPSLPHDLLAKLEILPGSRVESGAQVRTTLSLERAGKPIDKLEVSAPQEMPGYESVLADQLVDGLFRSPQLAAFTRDLRKPGSKDHLAAASLRAALAKGHCATPPPPEAPVVETPAAPPTPPPPPATTSLPGAAQPQAWAFIVGLDETRAAGKVSQGRADAERFADLARRTLGVPEGHVKTAFGDKADKLAFDLTLEWLKLNVPAGARIYFYFSGKGVLLRRNATEYLVPFDGDLGAIDTSCISLPGFLKALLGTKAQEVIAFVDAGFAGRGPRSAIADGKPPHKMPKTTIPPRAILFSAVSGTDAALEAEAGGGLYSRFLVHGLGHGHADVDGDGKVTLGELSAWMAPRVARAAKKQGQGQTPAVLVGPGTGSAAGLTVVSGLPAE